MGRKTYYQICSYSFNLKKHIKRVKSYIISINRQTKQKQLKELLSESDDDPEPVYTNRGAKLPSLFIVLREFGSFFYLNLDKHNMLTRCRGPPFFLNLDF
ncbi:MAG: hypothetical protein BGN88_12640 [Clostridiales bacterium 43-6]|nr:MAG: hypothetical protein BGN88_12640 [Clostridiales bacterium 43-6]